MQVISVYGLNIKAFIPKQLVNHLCGVSVQTLQKPDRKTRKCNNYQFQRSLITLKR